MRRATQKLKAVGWAVVCESNIVCDDTMLIFPHKEMALPCVRKENNERIRKVRIEGEK